MVRSTHPVPDFPGAIRELAPRPKDVAIDRLAQFTAVCIRLNEDRDIAKEVNATVLASTVEFHNIYGEMTPEERAQAAENPVVDDQLAATNGGYRFKDRS